jgi:hypothetical protein
MKAKLIIDDGREIEIDISEEELVKFKPKMNTGYEKVGHGRTYSFVNTYGEVRTLGDEGSDDDLNYDIANYYSNRTVAENNARADKLMRQLRRFSVEHRNNELDWNDIDQGKYTILFDYLRHGLEVVAVTFSRRFGSIYFDSKETAQRAIYTFRDELTWYFTEYKDSL